MKPCDVDQRIRLSPEQTQSNQEKGTLNSAPHAESDPSDAVSSRRRFLRNVVATGVGLSCADFLSYFLRFGAPFDSKAFAMSDDAARAGDNPHFLVNWFLEGGWMGYDMFNPVLTQNNVVHRLDDPSQERYRILEFGKETYGIYQTGNIRHGYLANEGKSLFPDLAVLSSVHTEGTGHSSERLRAHYGSYKFSQRSDRQNDERSINQAFAEVYGQSYALPNLSWHRWLSDGEINVTQYTGRKGFYHALGPAHAHTIYAGTPTKLKSFLLKMLATSADQVHREVERFLDAPHRRILKDENIEAVKSYRSAREIYKQLVSRGGKIDSSVVSSLFTDSSLRSEFDVKKDDELFSYRSVNGNKARSKFSPNVNVQAMMTYELMRAGLTCTAWIESRDVRRFDSHMSRGRLWDSAGKPVGQKSQTEMMKQDLWDPLQAFVRKLKTTEYGDSGSSLFDHSTIVLGSEFGRSMHGDVAKILKSKSSDEEKKKKIDGQDISAHWRVSSAAFLGGNVAGNRQYGSVGEKTLTAVPIMPDGSLDPAYDALSGELRDGAKKSEHSSIPNHGDIYATALYLSDINPQGRGRNRRGPMRFIRQHETRRF